MRPNHHSRWRSDRVFVSGRATRSMNRFGLQRDYGNSVVDVNNFSRQDKNAAE